MKRRNIPAALGAILGTVLALVFSAAQARAADPQNDFREEFHQTYPLAADGRLELSDLNGDTTITAWDRSEVKIDAVKIARDTQRLNECKIEVAAHPDSISIHTQYPDKTNNNPAIVNYTIMVPRNARIDAVKLVNGAITIEGLTGSVRGETVNGDVIVRAVTGAVHVSTVNGTVSALMNTVANSIRMESVNGAVGLTLPSDVNADVSASTVNGSITNEFGLTVDKGRYTGESLRGTLGNGGMRVNLSTVNGSIALRHASDGKPLGKATDLSRHRDGMI